MRVLVQMLVWLDQQYSSRYENGNNPVQIVLTTDPAMYDYFYPMHLAVLALPESEKLHVNYWLENSELGDPWKSAWKHVREERDARIKIILEKNGHLEWSPGYWQRFHGYVGHEQRMDWEEKSGEIAILPE